jgi:signal transduction histidine kinase
MNVHDHTESPPAAAAAHRTATANTDGALRRWRWWGAGVGLLTGLGDALILGAFGVRFEMNGHDATLLVGGYFGLSFALLGFLLGSVAAARRRERAATALIQTQTEAITATRARLAQSEKLAALGQLAAAIAHEVRNPLAVIRSAAQGLGEAVPAADQDARRASAFITAEIDRLNNVIASLLAFARPPQLQPRAVAVRELFDRGLQLTAHELAAKHVRVQRHEPADLPAVQVDADLISQVLVGLLANAVEAVPSGGEVSLQARAVDGAVEIDVADSGPGVPLDLRERIFEPFFTTRARGTGLGLAITRQIVEAHVGRIEVGERIGGGARFTVRLPVARGAGLAACKRAWSSSTTKSAWPASCRWRSVVPATNARPAPAERRRSRRWRRGVRTSS